MTNELQMIELVFIVIAHAKDISDRAKSIFFIYDKALCQVLYIKKRVNIEFDIQKCLHFHEVFIGIEMNKICH